MKKTITLLFVLLFTCVSVVPQATTTLSVSATWDDGTPIVYKAVLTQYKVLGPAALSYSANPAGIAKVTKALDVNTVYYVRLMTPNANNQYIDYLYQFPFTTTLIDVKTFHSATATFIFRKADRSLAAVGISAEFVFPVTIPVAVTM